MPLNTFNMVEFPRLEITKVNFDKVIHYLRLVKWWNVEDDGLKKRYFISCLDRECRKSWRIPS